MFLVRLLQLQLYPSTAAYGSRPLLQGELKIVTVALLLQNFELGRDWSRSARYHAGVSHTRVSCVLVASGPSWSSQHPSSTLPQSSLHAGNVSRNRAQSASSSPPAAPTASPSPAFCAAMMLCARSSSCFCVIPRFAPASRSSTRSRALVASSCASAPRYSARQQQSFDPRQQDGFANHTTKPVHPARSATPPQPPPAMLPRMTSVPRNSSSLISFSSFLVLVYRLWSWFIAPGLVFSSPILSISLDLVLQPRFGYTFSAFASRKPMLQLPTGVHYTRTITFPQENQTGSRMSVPNAFILNAVILI